MTRSRSCVVPWLALVLWPALALWLALLNGCASGQPDAVHERLQGRWEGHELGRESPDGPYVRTDPDHKVSIAFDGHLLRFHKRDDFQWEATFTLPAETSPQQLHATIVRPEDSAGDVVKALIRFDGSALWIGGIRSGDDDSPWAETFEDAKDTMGGRYELRRVSEDVRAR